MTSRCGRVHVAVQLRSLYLVNANRSFRPDGRWTIQKEAGPSGCHWHEQWMAPEADCGCHASCNLPSSEISLVSGSLYSPARSILPFKPQDPRPTSLENLPTEFAPLNSSIRNPVARQLLFEPVVVLSCAQQLGATSSMACSCDWFGCAGTFPWSVGVQENPTPAADGDASPRPRPEARRAAFIAFLSITKRYQQLVVHMHEQ